MSKDPYEEARTAAMKQCETAVMQCFKMATDPQQTNAETIAEAITAGVDAYFRMLVLKIDEAAARPTPEDFLNGRFG